MSEPPAPAADVAVGDLAALHTATPAELRAARLRQVVGPRWLQLPAEWIRTVARSTALSSFLVALVAFACYPRPWGSHWTIRKRITVDALELALIVSFISVVCCVVAYALEPACPSAARRPLRQAVWGNTLTFLLAVTTPSI